jgi:hypothetical protein
MNNIFGIIKSAKVTRTGDSTRNVLYEMHAKKFIREGIPQWWRC